MQTVKPRARCSRSGLHWTVYSSDCIGKVATLESAFYNWREGVRHKMLFKRDHILARSLCSPTFEENMQRAIGQLNNLKWRSS